MNLDIVIKKNVELPLIYSNFIRYKSHAIYIFSKFRATVAAECQGSIWQAQCLDQCKPLAREVLVAG